MKPKSYTVEAGEFALIPTKLRTREGRLLWRVKDDCRVRISADGKVIIDFTIPGGFHTDAASAPRPIQPLLDEALIFSLAAGAHDYGYFLGLPRAICDAMFFVLMGEVEAPRWQKFLMWKTVENLGGRAYANHRKKGHPLNNVNRFD